MPGSVFAKRTQFSFRCRGHRFWDWRMRNTASAQRTAVPDMIASDFRQSLTATERPAGLTHAFAGLWWDGKRLIAGPLSAS